MIAIATLNTFTSGNTENIEKFVVDDYIQHNAKVETRKKAIINFVKFIASKDKETTIKIIRTFDNGEYIVYVILWAQESM